MCIVLRMALHPEVSESISARVLMIGARRGDSQQQQQQQSNNNTTTPGAANRAEIQSSVLHRTPDPA